MENNSQFCDGSLVLLGYHFVYVPQLHRIVNSTWGERKKMLRDDTHLEKMVKLLE